MSRTPITRETMSRTQWSQCQRSSFPRGTIGEVGEAMMIARMGVGVSMRVAHSKIEEGRSFCNNSFGFGPLEGSTHYFRRGKIDLSWNSDV